MCDIIEIHIACPNCNNKRLFDVEDYTEGLVRIKCPRCKSIVAVYLNKQKIRTEQIGTQS